MGKLRDEPTRSDRVLAARARLERLRKEQGVPEFDLAKLLTCTYPSDESDEEFIAFLREIRTEGAKRQ